VKYDIVIIGAGASGLVAAYRAITQNSQLNILVLEKESTVGRKLNASGNGKCNLTNSNYDTNCYFSDSDNFISEWTQQHSYEDIISFFEEMGILLYERQGYYYPLSNQAKQVSSHLYEKSRMLGVEYRLNTKVTNIIQDKYQTGYRITAKDKDNKESTYESMYVLLATGGYASAKLGGCKDGYKLASNMQLRCNSIYPVLSPIYVEDKHLSVAKGVRLDGKVMLKIQDEYIMKEEGQIQFNDNNLSGIVMMNASCYLNRRKNEMKHACIYLDVFPQYTWDNLKAFFVEQMNTFPETTLDVLLKGILPGNFVSYICKRLGLERSLTLKNVTDKMLNRITSALKKLEFLPVYKDDFDKAQVTGGGISVDEVSVDTFESKQYKHLYITGEVLDVNGKCGGYNLTFAILSAIQAMDNIIMKNKKSEKNND